MREEEQDPIKIDDDVGEELGVGLGFDGDELPHVVVGVRGNDKPNLVEGNPVEPSSLIIQFLNK